MLVLDTNVVSELMRPRPVSAVLDWFAGHDIRKMYLTAISEAELHYGVATTPTGKRKTILKNAMAYWLDHGFGERILPFDSAAARAYGEIAAECRRSGRPISKFDCQIEAICQARNAVLVTRNVRDFQYAGIGVADPWVGA
ncbi:MAG: type II toxin-antitoxin system VapC family toxin [Gammaproteobacteria bacterium]|nr:type II toxin-antitoxin system VapC family toxin [Gammaproteobacteria bacterium]